MEPLYRHGGDGNADMGWERLDPRFEAPETPSSASGDASPGQTYGGRASENESEEEEAPAVRGELVPRRKPGGYDSRVEQILYENPEVPILITDAGKSMESGGKYIVYTIRTGVRQRSVLQGMSPLNHRCAGS